MSQEEPLLDIGKARKLTDLCEALTHTGSKELNNAQLKEVFSICNEGKSYIESTFNDLLRFLKKQHAEVRFSVSQLCHLLFMKYEVFRDLLLNILVEYFQLTLGIQTLEPLPPPAPAAKAMVRSVLQNFYQWHQHYASNKPQLRMGYMFLVNRENVDFTTFEIVDPKERAEREERDRRMMRLNKEHLKNMCAEMEDLMPELDSTLKSLESCFDLLLPPPEDIQKSQLPSSSEGSDMRLHGVINRHQEMSLQIELSSKVVIKEDNENSAILEAAKDAHKLINNRFLPKTKAWVEIICKAQGGSELMKKSLEVRSKLEAALAKYSLMEVIPRYKKEGGEAERESGDDEVSSDSELEEVETPESRKTNHKEEIAFLSRAALGVSEDKKKKVKNKKKEESGCCEPAPGPSGVRENGDEANERKKKLLEVAPKLPFDIDLYHWEDEKLPTPTMVAVNSEGSRFWGGAASEELTEIPVPEGASSLRTRVIEFVGQWEPVGHTCRAPLPSGKLCPRQDRLKCPFHGLIVARDEEGKIINKEDEERVAKSKSNNKPEVAEWQDPKLLAEIKAQTGIDLKMPEKGKRMPKKKQYPGLTDLKEKKNTPVSRISKKIFNKNSLKRVAATLDKLEHKRHRDKFGDQFNYVHNS